MQQSLTHAMVFFDPLALALVLMGSLVLAGTQEGWRSIQGAILALPVLFRPNQDENARLARNAGKRVARIVEKRGINCADRVKVDPHFVQNVIREVANQKDPSSFREWTRNNIVQRQTRHAFAARFWSTVAEIAPALGMIGTVIGLVLMFGQVEDAAAIGQSMAVAMLTTLYGLILGNVIAGPIAVRLIRASESEIAWQQELADQLFHIVEREYLASRPGLDPGRSGTGFRQCA